MNILIHFRGPLAAGLAHCSSSDRRDRDQFAGVVFGSGSVMSISSRMAGRVLHLGHLLVSLGRAAASASALVEALQHMLHRRI